MAQRYFKVIDPVTGECQGRYTGTTPKQAASKAFTKVIQRQKQAMRDADSDADSDTDSDADVQVDSTPIYLRESTRASDRKVFGYTCKKIQLDEPIERHITSERGETITISQYSKNHIEKRSIPNSLREKFGLELEYESEPEPEPESKSEDKQTDNKLIIESDILIKGTADPIEI